MIQCFGEHDVICKFALKARTVVRHCYLLKKNSSEFIASISHKTHLVVTQVLMPALLIFSATIILLAIFTVVLLIEPFAALIIIFGFGCDGNFIIS